MTADAADKTDAAILRMTAEIASAYLGHNSLGADKLPEVIRSIHAALAEIKAGPAPAAPKQEPAVAPSRSVKPDYIVCLEDGKKLKMLKRHLRTSYNMSPDDYRAKWGLPASYPMVAPNYAKRRSEFAKKIGLGTLGRKARKK
ncbi:MAG: transcriptional regulator [Alphaproteobacteria bacterium]|nr:transcriptional regulator [Alphaproteobacteria bacterium]